MGGHGGTGRFVVGVCMVAILGGCAAASSAPPSDTSSSAPPTGAPSVAVATPSASAVSPASTIELTGFSVRPFGLAVTTSAYFAVDAGGNIYLPGGSTGAALVKMAPDGSVLARSIVRIGTA